VLSLNLIKNKGSRSYLRFKRREHRGDQASYVYLKTGEPLILIGGVQTGKTRKLITLKQLMEKYQEPVIYLDGLLPLGDWLNGYEGKNILTRTESLLGSATKETYILIDNAEKINDSRKLATVLTLLEKGRNMVVACNKLVNLNWKLRRRLELKGAHIEYLGVGGEIFDVTMILVAILVGCIALIGAINWLLGVAAMRYLFQGIRIGGRKI
jgi:hypothetical protein